MQSKISTLPNKVYLGFIHINVNNTQCLYPHENLTEGTLFETELVLFTMYVPNICKDVHNWITLRLNQWTKFILNLTDNKKSILIKS